MRYAEFPATRMQVRAALDMQEPQIAALWEEFATYRRERRFELALRCLNWLRFIKAIRQEWQAKQLKLF